LGVASPSSPSVAFASMSSLLNAGDVQTTWARVGTSGMGGASHSSGVESELVECVLRSRHETWGVVFGRGPRYNTRIFVS
jgi:hypothetical protein